MSDVLALAEKTIGIVVAFCPELLWRMLRVRGYLEQQNEHVKAVTGLNEICLFFLTMVSFRQNA